MRYYKQVLSDRAMGILVLLKEPLDEQIRRQKSIDFIGTVGTYFDEIRSRKGISMEILRKLMRAELYGIAGVFFRNHEGTHSLEKLKQDITDQELDRLSSEGHTFVFSADGTQYKARQKIVSAQTGLYIPEAVKTEFEETIDNPEFIFEKRIEEQSIPILEYILRRTQELRERHGNNWYPYFSNASIARALSLDQNLVESTTRNLTGILCECHQTVNYKDGQWRLRYFLPTSKYPFIKSII
jgi:hypothetical protein